MGKITLRIPEISCKITCFCPIFPSEDPQKVKLALSNVFDQSQVSLEKNQAKTTSLNLESLQQIFEAIHSRGNQRIYQRQLQSNLHNDNTWFYLNKQAAFVGTIALCTEEDESPLGPITVKIKSDKIENIIEWLISV